MDIITDILAKGHWMEIYQAIIGVLLTALGIVVGYGWSQSSTGKAVEKNTCQLSSQASEIKTLFHRADRSDQLIDTCMRMHQELLPVVKELISQNTILIHQKERT